MNSASQDFVPLVSVTRGEVEESVHFGAVAVSDSAANLLAHVGSPDRVAMTRSSLKPFQALPMVERGGIEKWGLTEKELAVMCASHNGEPMHLETVQSILRKIGLDESYLGCGVHDPAHTPTFHEMLKRGERARPIHNNCSGKHAGMLALALLLGADPRTYYKPESPVQRTIKETVAELAGMRADELKTGTDGCNVVNIGLPMSKAALLFALLADPSHLPPPRAAALRRIFAAMLTHPEMVAGTGRFCTSFIRAGRGRWVGKAGAEAMYGVALKPPSPFSAERGVGIVCKIADGDRPRAGQVKDGGEMRVQWLVIGRILEDAGLLDDRAKAEMGPLLYTERINWHGANVGAFETMFHLGAPNG